MNPKLDLVFIIKCDVLWVMRDFSGITQGILFAVYSSDEKQFSLQSEKIGVTLYLQRNESCILNAKVHFIMRYEKGRKYGESQRRSCKNGHGPV